MTQRNLMSARKTMIIMKNYLPEFGKQIIERPESECGRENSTDSLTIIEQ